MHKAGFVPKEGLRQGWKTRAEGFPGAELAQARPKCPSLTRWLSAAGAQDTGMCPQEDVLLSLGGDVYVGGNPTWMGLCMHACIAVFVFECMYDLKCVN